MERFSKFHVGWNAIGRIRIALVVRVALVVT
jgi:hypothetical protein